MRAQDIVWSLERNPSGERLEDEAIDETIVAPYGVNLQKCCSCFCYPDNVMYKHFFENGTLTLTSWAGPVLHGWKEVGIFHMVREATAY